MGRQLAVAFALLMITTTACQPLYGNKPDKLAKLTTKKRPPEEKIAEVPIPWITECTPNFRDDPKGVRQLKVEAQTITAAGDAALDAARKAKDPAGQASNYREAVDKYSNALRKDPYNADATLKLAIAYDAVYRKGCALAMLKRLDTLTKNPKVSPEASRIVDTITDNASMFKHYHQEAVTAAGR